MLNSPPNEVTGCNANFLQNGDLDFDGSGYWSEWPTGPAATSVLPGSFVQGRPTSQGQNYSGFFFQTDAALSESTCTGFLTGSTSGCAVPPPNAPGQFYPYWSEVKGRGGCSIEFGNVSTGTGVNSFNRDAQYGTDQLATFGYDEIIGPVHNNNCT